EKMHVRVRALRQPSGAILNEAAEWMGIQLLERGAQRYGQRPPPVCFAERAVATRISEQSESLVIEVETRIADLTVQIDHRHDRRVCGDEVLCGNSQAHGAAPRARNRASRADQLHNRRTLGGR